VPAFLSVFFSYRYRRCPFKMMIMSETMPRMTTMMTTSLSIALILVAFIALLGGLKPMAEAMSGMFGSNRPAIDAVVPYWTRSVQLYKHPHAIWLAAYEYVGVNLPELRRTLETAKAQKRRPELVVYGIPYRDMGQSSGGGFDNYQHYYEDNRQNAKLVKAFVRDTGIKPRVYLEPDALGHAIQYRRDRHDDTESMALYNVRTNAMRFLIDLYQDAGALVYLDAAHSAWFDYGDSAINDMATILEASGIKQADGLAVNISNRQQAGPDDKQHTEAHYLKQLLPKLNEGRQTPLDVVMDTSRNGGATKPRHYLLADNGDLVDTEYTSGRWVGTWQQLPNGDRLTKPLFGKPMKVSILTGLDKFQYDDKLAVLTAPKWLDPVGDVKLGPAPTDSPNVPYINRYRYIKPPDDCDGSLNCPSRVDEHATTNSKHDIWEATAKVQHQHREYQKKQTLWLSLTEKLSSDAQAGNPN
jgi:hypothetical protein